MKDFGANIELIYTKDTKLKEVILNNLKIDWKGLFDIEINDINDRNSFRNITFKFYLNELKIENKSE